MPAETATSSGVRAGLLNHKIGFDQHRPRLRGNGGVRLDKCSSSEALAAMHDARKRPHRARTDMFGEVVVGRRDAELLAVQRTCIYNYPTFTPRFSEHVFVPEYDLLCSGFDYLQSGSLKSDRRPFSVCSQK